jgi:hypothetical protein
MRDEGCVEMSEEIYNKSKLDDLLSTFPYIFDSFQSFSEQRSPF